MAKDEKPEPKKAPPAPAPEPQTGCVVCGSYGGTFTGAAGHARWHATCETARSDVIRKVKSRA